ncbi:MAG: FadR/GntR family transcriptional regulator [Eubacteriales bacterium]
MKLKPVSRSSLPDAIIEQIKKLMLDGHLKPGDRLPSERELGEKFTVGRTSVREALKALSFLGLLKRTNEGTFINDEPAPLRNQLSYSLIYKKITIKEVFETRRLFEIRLAALAAKRATDEDLTAMEKALAADKGDVHSFVNSDLAFHVAIAEAAQNKILYELFVTVEHLLFHSHWFYLENEGKTRQEMLAPVMNRARYDHARLMEAIRSQNVELAEKAIVDHLNAMEEFLLQLS